MKITVGQLRRIIKEVVDEDSSYVEYEDMSPEEQRREDAISVYSDVYKEKNGIRPRWMIEPFRAMSADEVEAELEKLYDTRGYDDVDYLPVEQEFPDMEGTVSPDDPAEPFEELGDAPRAIAFKGGNEYDALSAKSKGLRSWRPGQRKAAKTSYNRRLRHSK